MDPLYKSLRGLFTRGEIAFALAKSALEHRRVEQALRRRASSALGGRDGLDFPYLRLPPLQYFQRNFFSIMFLSIYEVIGIPKERRLSYGMIMHAVRGVVTASDNILDGQENGGVRLHLDGGHVLPNILLILLHDGIAHQVISEVARDDAVREHGWGVLVKALHDIAREECSEEQAVETVLSPEDVLSTIHEFRGGRLFQLAFAVPLANEPELAPQIEEAMRGVKLIGLGLQTLDDVTDFAEDIESRNHNMLRSWIVHRAPDGPATDGGLVSLSPSDRAAPERCFPKATAEVLNLALGLVMDGYDCLHGLGHAVSREVAPDLVKLMFRLRGLSHLWELCEESLPAADRARSLLRA